MKTTVSNIIQIINNIAPPELAEQWDNCGLQIGKKNLPVHHIRTALDPAFNVVDAACRDNVDLLITHHPLIFKPVKSINLNSQQGLIIEKAIKNELAIFSAHTNLDSAVNGVGDSFALILGLKNIRPLASSDNEPQIYKLTVFVPAEFEDEFLKALFQTQTGNIGNYSNCTFRNRGTGTFKPGPLSSPYSGTIGEISRAKEIRFETVVSEKNLKHTVEYLKSIHPYETMAYDVYPLIKKESVQGIGRIGELEKDITLEQLVFDLQKKLDLQSIKYAGNKKLKIRQIAVCPGSGSSLLKRFLSSQADVYISGDIGYHDARDVEAAGRAVIDTGHFASERIIVPILAEKLKTALAETNNNIIIDTCKLEKDPFDIYYEKTN